MLVLILRSDNPKAEVGLYENGSKIDHYSWQAHRELAETIHSKIDELLQKNHKSLSGLNGLVVFKGPGSFTGLRIGLSVANALAYSLSIPVVTSQGEQWISAGIKRLSSGENDNIGLPEYSHEAHVTKPRK